MIKKPWDYFDELIRAHKVDHEKRMRRAKLFETFLSTFQVDKIAEGIPCPRRLGRGKGGGALWCIYTHQNRKCLCRYGTPPPGRYDWVDHPVLYLRDGRPAVFTSQPYGTDRKPDDAVKQFCEEQGLEIHLLGNDASFYNPGSTSLIVIARPLLVEAGA